MMAAHTWPKAWTASTKAGIIGFSDWLICQGIFFSVSSSTCNCSLGKGRNLFAGIFEPSRIP
jgi:hypothetical protein